MRFFMIGGVAAFISAAAMAADKRQLGAHEHGVGNLNMAFEGSRISIEFEAPGADIVGFEYAAETAEDRAKIDGAIALLAKPLDLFVIPAAAGCSVVEASSALIGDDHGEHDHDDHGAEAGQDDHAEEAGHGEHGHGHSHDEHAEGQGHGEHAEEASHTEFHAEYLLDCADPSAIDRIDFAYFSVFPNAEELEIQMISDRGANSFEVERDDPSLSLAGRI
ncbi:MAG: DUF2796 domain-containing protein [Pseudomonadota bacterium]